MFLTKLHRSTDDGIKNFAIDEYGVIWGAAPGGIVKIRISRLPLRNYSSRGPGLTLPADRIIAMSNAPGNELFVGYEDNSFDVFDPVKVTRKNFKTMDNSRIMGFYPFSETEYIALSEHELEIINPGQQARVKLSSRYPFIKKDLLLENSLNCVLVDGPVLWMGTSSGLAEDRSGFCKTYCD